MSHTPPAAVANIMCCRKRAPVDRDLSVIEASRIMRSSGSDELLVTDKAEGELVTVGIVTARDIVTRIVAAGLDPAVVTAGDITWAVFSHDAPPDAAPAVLHPVAECESEVLALMHSDGRVAGVVTIGELMKVLVRDPPYA